PRHKERSTMKRNAIRLDVSHPVNLMAPDVRANPYPLYALLRQEAPVCQVEPGGMWAVTRYDDALTVLKDPHRFSSGGWSQALHPPWLVRTPMPRALPVMDPPAHTKLRNLVTAAFSGAAMVQLQERVRAIAEALAARVIRQREVEFVTEFAIPLP